MGNTGFKVSSVFFILSLLSDKTFQTINNLLREFGIRIA